MKKILLFTILAISFGLNAQTITSVSPNSADAGETLQVTITGNSTLFMPVSSSYGISFYNEWSQHLLVNSLNIVSNTEIIANVTIPANAITSSFDLEVYADSSNYSLANAFTVTNGANPPVITSVTPNTANAGETLQVTITGDNTVFSQVSETSNVSFYNSLGQELLVNSIDMVSNTTLIAEITIPQFMPTGLYDLFINAGLGYNLDNAFSVVNTFNIISGTITVDTNGNGCDASDDQMAGIKVTMNDGTSDSSTFTDSLGNYSFYVPQGNFTISPEMPLYTTSPGSAVVNFNTQNNLTEDHDFCLQANGIYNDVDITILPLEAARPGFNATYLLVYKNNGNQPMTGTITFEFDDSRLDFVSAAPMVTSQALNNLTWTYNNLLPFESGEITITLNVNSPMETPAVNNGDSLNYISSINPIVNDETPSDNIAQLTQIVVGSYDPNDKAITEGSQVNINNVDNYLHYLIRFQNSGTFAAENVVIRDMLSANLDASTLQVVSTSHPYRATLTSGNKLEFFFENINLPPEMTDEPGSHGFVSFKIKPSNTVTLGSVIENTADIFFDFNFPIVTNTVATTFTVLSNNSYDFANGIQLYPNPAGSLLNIESEATAEITSVKIYNQLGQLLKNINDFERNRKTIISVEDLKTGTYFVQITSDKGTSVKKLIKL